MGILDVVHTVIKSEEVILNIYIMISRSCDQAAQQWKQRHFMLIPHCFLKLKKDS